MTNVIKANYINDQGNVSPVAYTFYTPEEVKPLDIVVIRFHQDGRRQLGIVEEINVPLSEIEKFGDNAKTIVGLSR